MVRGNDPGPCPGASDAVAPGAVPPSPQPTLRGRKPEIAVQFNPPPGVQPGMVGTIVDESADTIDVSATVMDLAVRGFLRIEETQSGTMFSRTDWRLVQLPPPPGQTLRPYEATVLDGLFSTGSDVKLSDLKYKFHTTLNLAIRQMYSEVVDRGWFRRSPQRQRQGWQALGFLLIGAGVVSCFYLGVVTNAIDQTGKFGIGIPSGVVLGLGLIVAGLIFRILGKRMAAKPPPVRRCTCRRSASASTSRPPRPARSGSRRRRRSSAGTSRTRRVRCRRPVGRNVPEGCRGRRGGGEPAGHADLVSLQRRDVPRLLQHRGRRGQLRLLRRRDVRRDSHLRFVGRVRVQWRRLQRRWWRRGFELGFLVGVGRSTRVSEHAAWPLGRIPGRITESVAITTGSGIDRVCDLPDPRDDHARARRRDPGALRLTYGPPSDHATRP